MGQEHDTFWQLERANRRKTVELVMIFILVYCLIGVTLDLIFHTLRVVNHQLVGFPALTIAAAVISSAQALRAYYRGSSVLISAVGAQELTSESVKAQMVAVVFQALPEPAEPTPTAATPGAPLAATPAVAPAR